MKEVVDADEENPDGVEEGLDLAFEIHETVTSAIWIENIFYFTSPTGKINYSVSGKTFNFGHTDKKKFLIGYVNN